jgi:hypothetical protein
MEDWNGDEFTAVLSQASYSSFHTCGRTRSNHNIFSRGLFFIFLQSVVDDSRAVLATEILLSPINELKEVKDYLREE